MNILNTIIQKPNTNIYTVKPQEKKEVKRNVFTPIDTTNLIKPDRPTKSYIINDPFYMAPVNFLTDIKENVVNIAKATTGKSNDHDLGRINDFSMKAGALALAGYLFAHGKTSLSKSMEFVGFGTFFASMALWPKLFIQAPLKAMYGIDVHQKYMDNEGRKKMFFQDPQYIPWDLYTDEQLSQLGDRLGVPRDIHNRNEVIKKKAHKIALQGNTLWMLTAGFATPLMSALMCNGIEKIVTPRSERTSFPNNIFGAFASSIEKMRIDKIEKMMKNLDNNVAKKVATLDDSELSSYLRCFEGSEMDEAAFDDLLDKMQSSTDVNESAAKRAQVMELFEVTKVEPKADAEYIDEFWQKYNVQKVANKYQTTWSELLSKEQLEALAKENGETVSVRTFWGKLTAYIDSKQFGMDEGLVYKTNISKIIGDYKTTEKRIVTKDFIQNVLRLNRKIYEHSLRLNAMNKYYDLFMGNDSIIVNRRTNVQNAFFNSLEYTKKEIAQARLQGVMPLELLQSKIEALVANINPKDGKEAVDATKYTEAVRKIHRAILDFDTIFLPDSPDGSPQGVKKAYLDMVNKFIKRESQMFEDAGFTKMSERIIGSKETNLGSLGSNMIDRAVRRIDEIRDGMYKLLYTLDFFRRTTDIKKGNIPQSEFVRAYKNFDFNKYNQLPHEYSDNALLDEIQKMKRIMLEATSSEHVTKLDCKERGIYVRMMNLLYSTNLDDMTNKALGAIGDDATNAHKLGNTTFIQSFKKTINEVLNNLGDFIYPHNDSLVLNTNDELENLKKVRLSGDAGVRDSKTAESLLNSARDWASQKYNSSKWFGKFGTMGVVLVGVTLLSQVFFGKINKEDLEYVRKDNN